MTQRPRHVLLGLSLGIALFLSAHMAQAATISFSPDAGTYAVGDTFTVSVVVSSPNKPINAFSGEVLYPADMLSIVQVSKTDSIASFWTIEPSAKNGTVRYEGITLNPGYAGSNGKIVSVTFKALTAGSADVRFASASVLANDGLGTNVASTLGSASYSLVAGTIPSTPVITSSTNPDQGAWYANPNAVLAWNVPSNVTQVDYSVSKNAGDAPRSGSGILHGASPKALTDGVWYAHVRFKNTHGSSKAAAYKMQIDTRPPFGLVVAQAADAAHQSKYFSMSAKDAGSGIATFGVRIDGRPEVSVSAKGNAGTYVSGSLSSGTHTYQITAYDRAGNTQVQTGSFGIASAKVPALAALAIRAQGMSGIASVLVGLIILGIVLCIVLLMKMVKIRR